jgi:hypothetical protein
MEFTLNVNGETYNVDVDLRIRSAVKVTAKTAEQQD